MHTHKKKKEKKKEEVSHGGATRTYTIFSCKKMFRCILCMVKCMVISCFVRQWLGVW